MPGPTITHSVSHQLKLALSDQQLQYGVCDKAGQLLTSGERFLTDQKSLQDLLDRDDILSNIYSNSQLMVLSPKFVLAPEEIGRHDHNYELLKMGSKVKADERMFRDHTLEQKEIQHTAPREFMRLIKNKFPNIKRRHVAAFFVDQIAKAEQTESVAIQVYVQDNHLYLTISNSGSLLLSNSYFCSSSEDLFYFVMLAIEQLKLEPRECAILLYQANAMNQSLTNLYKNYVQSVELRCDEQSNFVEIWNACE